jgi:glycine/D-amino acid oxidase-like deaminating enzyme
MDPDTANRFVTAEQTAAARDYVRDRFPVLADAPVVDSRVCQYENTANGDFIIDRHPQMDNVWIAGGGSGHGFKHGPAVGEYLVARMEGRNDPPVETRFALSTKGTEQKRAVY